MNKSLQTAKIEELQKIYKDYKLVLKESLEYETDLEKRLELKAELFWIKTFIKDLKWLLDDETY